MGLNVSNSDRSVHEICTYTRSSIVMPACASTAFSPSSKFLISSSIFSGVFPVFGSSPSRPAKYSVFPARIPSLNGNCELRSPSLIAFLVVCGEAFENAPFTVRTPATARAITKNPVRRFMFSLHSNALPATPRECSTQTALRQATRTAISSPCKFCVSRYRVSFESKGDQPDSNKVKRSQSHRHPQQHALQQWSPPHFFQSPARDSRANQKKSCGEPEAAEREKCFCGGMLRRQVGVREGGKNKKQNEPRKLNLRAVAFCGRRDQRQRDDPEGRGEFDGGADY